jgi:tRNA A58 N-methylase Trm61
MHNPLPEQNGTVDYTADHYTKTASFVFSDEFTAPIISWLNASPGDRVIDIGCGSGELTVKIQTAVGAEGFVLGVDYNEDMVSASLLTIAHQPDISFVDIQSVEERCQKYVRLRCPKPSITPWGIPGEVVRCGVQ